MRSLLFVPGDDERKIAKGLASAADALILDLEDAVAPARKSAAREICAKAIASSKNVKRLFVRVNALDTGQTHFPVAHPSHQRPVRNRAAAEIGDRCMD